MVTPIMGSKSVFVALFLFLLGLSPEPISLATWTAAGLAAVAVALIGWPTKVRPRYREWLSRYAPLQLSDWSIPWFRTSPINPTPSTFFVMFSTLGFSFALIPEPRKISRLERSGRRWMWASSLPMGGQAVLMSFAIGFFRCPPLRTFSFVQGLWAILLVAFLGRRKGLREGNVSRSTQIRRANGSGLLVLGI